MEDRGVEARLREALDQRDILARTARLAEVLSSLGPESIDVARASVLAHHEAAVAEQALMVSWWARHEPQAAFEWAQKGDDLSVRAGLMIAAMREWGERDPKAAAAAVEGMAGSLKIPCRLALVRGWYLSGGEGLSDYIRDLEMGRDQQGAIQGYARAIAAHKGPDAIIAWAEGLSPDDPPQFRGAARRHAGWVLAEVAPDRASQWAEEQDDNLLRELVAASWARSDGPAAIKWSASLVHKGPYEQHPVRMALRHWLTTDRAGAFEWILERHPSESSSLAPAAGAIAMAIARKHPVRALEWAAIVPDEAKRDDAYQTLLGRWHKRDAEAARAWVEADSMLPEPLRARFLAAVNQAPDAADSESADPPS